MMRPAPTPFRFILLSMGLVLLSACATTSQQPACPDGTQDLPDCPPQAAIDDPEINALYEARTLVSAKELEEDLIEEYEYLNKQGEIEQRKEEPYATWYTTGGEILEPITLYPYIETGWVAPKSGKRGTWYAVVRDRRGGMTWHTQDWVVD